MLLKLKAGNLNWVPVTLFLLVASVFFFETWRSLTSRWMEFDEGYSHGFLVFGICAYYTFDSFRKFNWSLVKPNYLFIPVLLGAGLLWKLSENANIEMLHQLVMPISLVSGMALCLGLKGSKPFWFPIFYLYTAIPFWDYLTLPLQELTVYINMVLLGLINLPAYIDGFRVTIPAGTFEIVGGCSGLRYLLVAIALALLYAYQNYQRWQSSALLMASAIGLAFITNWLRVFIIIYIGEVSNMESGLIEDHEMFGWFLFAISLVPFFFFAMKLADLESGDEDSQSPDPVSLEGTTATGQQISLASLVAAISIWIPVYAINFVVTQEPTPFLTPVFQGQSASQPSHLISPKFTGADKSIDQFYLIDNNPLQLSIRIYQTQSQGKELISYTNRIFNQDWRVLERENSNQFGLLKLRHNRNEQIIILGYRYSIGGVHTSNRTIAKLLELIKPLLSSQNSSIVILAGACDTNCDQAKGNIETFISHNKNAIDSL